MIRNAMQAMPNGGKIFIRTFRDKSSQSIAVEVEDTGCGIDPENLNKLFTPFFSTKETGTGLGLTLSYRIVQHHNGSISVESNKGSGTKFTVTLPYYETRSSANGKR